MILNLEVYVVIQLIQQRILHHKYSSAQRYHSVLQIQTTYPYHMDATDRFHRIKSQSLYFLPRNHLILARMRRLDPPLWSPQYNMDSPIQQIGEQMNHVQKTQNRADIEVAPQEAPNQPVSTLVPTLVLFLSLGHGPNSRCQINTVSGT